MTSVVDALRRDFEKLEVQVTTLGETLSSRMEDVEAAIINTDLRVDKLEDMLRQAPMTSDAVEAMIDNRFKELLSNTSSGARSPDPHGNMVNKRFVTMVVGNMDGLGDLSQATEWLKSKLASLSGPTPSKIYSKGAFSGIMFAEFINTDSRDKAVELLRKAGCTNGDKKIWATEDRSAPERAARNYCLGLKRILKGEWEIPYNISVSNEAPYIVTVGGEHALTAKVVGNSVEYEWQGEWATWSELHGNPLIKDLAKKSDDLLQRAFQGLKGSAKGGAKGRGPH